MAAYEGNTTSKTILSNRAALLFANANTHGKLHSFWSRLTRRCFSLLNLEHTLNRVEVKSSFYAGVRSVEIHKIRGTEGKSGEFDAEFNPIQDRSSDRWVSIAVERMRGRDLPPVKLVKLGEDFYVRDGHHRISVARALGQAFIDAEVIVMKTRAV